MGMFDTYDNLNPDYIPDNTTPEPSEKYFKVDKILPRPMYSIKNNLVGYSWTNGEFFDFTISVDSMITINSDSLVYEKPGEKPDELTVGKYKGQKAYNTQDIKSWTFVGRSTSNAAPYMWVEDKELTYPTDGDQSIIMNTNMTDRYILVNIYNFRWEEMYSQQAEIGESEIIINVNKELSEKLASGVYYCTVKICSEESAFLKDKFMISII